MLSKVDVYLWPENFKQYLRLQVAVIHHWNEFSKDEFCFI